ncbi:helix-turn-helix domain-containing protein [Flavobacterium sp. SM2513]|uniref:helix-turn-helix domain-containing protein n=1 Tax=Flavobacterium sp. SM2513 TaxID=3424766 RepID=UPI003D7F3736
MLNTDDFIKRLEFIMEHFSLSASSFADKISVQRSSISHLLSGRNKPSLDFVLKILDIFPELNLYWLLDGSGSYLKNDTEEIAVKEIQNTATPTPESELKLDLKTTATENTNGSKTEQILSKENSFSHQNKGKQLHKIVLFYTDGTFEDFKPNGLK